MKSFDDTKNHRIVPALNKKVVLTTIMFVSVMNISMYANTTSASATAPTSTGSTAYLIVGGTAQYMKHEGLTSEMRGVSANASEGNITDPLFGQYPYFS